MSSRRRRGGQRYTQPDVTDNHSTSATLNWQSPLVLIDTPRKYTVFWSLNRYNRFSLSFLIFLTSIKIGRIYGSVQRRHRYSKPPDQPIGNKCENYRWRCKYIFAAACAVFNRFKDQNTRRDSIYRYVSVNAPGDRHSNPHLHSTASLLQRPVSRKS